MAKELKIVEWAIADRWHGGDHYGLQRLNTRLDAPADSVPMAGSPAHGVSLLSNGKLGADLIYLDAGKSFAPHTHPGDHLLIVVGGEGTITYDGRVYPTKAGDIYMVEGSVPHAVGARTDHVILAVGSPHRNVDDPGRMTLTEYHAILSEIGEMHCLICNLTATRGFRLHDVGCSHCPCGECP